MKKRATKKLTLAKETLRNLESESLKDIYGAATDRSECFTICATNCTVCLTDCPRCA